MFGVVSYIGVCFAISGVITLLWAITRPVHMRGEMRSWRVWIAMFILANAAPYAFFEGLSQFIGNELKSVVEETLDIEKIDGDLMYYKVLFYNGTMANVVIVAEEASSWGGTDRPVMRLIAKREGSEWEYVSSNIVFSDNRNIDGVVFPPFW